MTRPPDGEALMIDYLNSLGVADLNVAADVPADLGDTVVRAVTVRGVNSPADPPAWNGPSLLWQVNVDLDAFAPTRAEASDLWLTVAALVPGVRHHVSQHGRVSRVTVPGGEWRPDFNQTVRRYGGVVSLVARPA